MSNQSADTLSNILFHKYHPLLKKLSAFEKAGYETLPICIFAIMGLIGGVFYREFTKAYHWTDVTRLSFVHLHLITLSFLWLIIVYLFF